MRENRRKFIKKTMAGAFGFSLLPNWVACSSTPPSGKLNVAFVGVGGRGAESAKNLCTYDKVNPVVFCDVDDLNAAKTYRSFPNVPRMYDYRRMFDKFGKDIDAVVISTPDHAHYPIAAWAMANGKHIYLEKPMTRTVWESREIARIAEKTGVITQLGNQGHSMDHWRKVWEWYHAGILGEVEEVYVWTDRPIWNQGPYAVPDGKEKIPATLDYKLWLNVAPDTPYSSLFVPFHWRGFRNFGTGAMGDHACHAFDWPYSALDLGMPIKMKGTSSEFNEFGWPKKMLTEFEFAAKGSRPPVKLYWFDASQKPKEIKGVPANILAATRNGTAIVGKKETAICFDQFGTNTMISPRERMVELLKSKALPEPTLPRIDCSHQRNFVNSCIEGKKAESDIVSYAADLNEFVLLGTIPIFFQNQELIFDPAKREFTNVKEANSYFNSSYAYKQEFLPGKI